MAPLAVSTVGLVLLVLAVLLLVLVIGGYIAAERRNQAREREFRRQLAEAEDALAQAHAADKGWDRATLEAAARQAAGDRFGSADIEALHLVQVLDRPGTDADQAVFSVRTPEGQHRITLGRTNGVWGPAWDPRGAPASPATWPAPAP